MNKKRKETNEILFPRKALETESVCVKKKTSTREQATSAIETTSRTKRDLGRNAIIIIIPKKHTSGHLRVRAKHVLWFDLLVLALDGHPMQSSPRSRWSSSLRTPQSFRRFFCRTKSRRDILFSLIEADGNHGRRFRGNCYMETLRGGIVVVSRGGSTLRQE